MGNTCKSMADSFQCMTKPTKIKKKKKQKPRSWPPGFPGGSGVRIRMQRGKTGFSPWVGKIRWRREWPPAPEFWPGESHGLCSPWGHQQSDVTETFTFMASIPITSWQIEWEKVETVTDFIFLGSQITVEGECSHEIERGLLLGRKAMTNLDSKALLCQKRNV